MGYCIELPPAAAPWSAELRGESFYLHTNEIAGEHPFPARLHEPWSRERINTGEFILPTDLAAGFRAALTEVKRWRQPQWPADTADDPWTITPHPDGLLVSGPAVVYPGAGEDGLRDYERTDDTTPWGPTHCIEIEYRHLNHLRVATTAAGAPA